MHLLMINKYLFPLIFMGLITISACSDHQVSLSDRDEFTPPEPPSLSAGKTPAEIFAATKNMFAETADYSTEELENLNRQELRDLAAPLLMLWEHTIRLNNNALSGLRHPVQKMADLAESGDLSPQIHEELSTEVRLVLSANRHEQRRDMEKELDRVKEILLARNSDQSIENNCRDLFNVTGDNVILFPGDNLAAANYYCPAGTFFYVTRGTYTGQSVSSPKAGNQWVGTGISPAILDGLDRTDVAFSGRMTNNLYSHFEIRNYREFGIHFIDRQRNENVEISHMVFRNVAGNVNGEEFGAVKMEWMQNLVIKHTHFENVASAIRIVNSLGPLRIENNIAINPGRNFFQCDKCSGSEIRITGNSMEHRQQYGTDVLEDYINLFQSDGNPDDRILVKNNRARGHGGSFSGSFIMLGDSGGSFQAAVDNIAVNPGQVGIGVAGGHNIRVENNRVFGEQWEGSNVGIYSTGFGEPCSNHEFPGAAQARQNRINWTNADGIPNPAWTKGDCGIDHETLINNIVADPDMGAEIWDEWEL